MTQISIIINTKMPLPTDAAKKQVADLILAFCSETIIGHERGMYRAGIPITIPTIQIISANYLNTCYKSLILKNDPFVIHKFKEMTDIIGHSEVCLISIIMQILLAMHQNLNRPGLNFESVETLEASLKAQLVLISSLIHSDLCQAISHECSGEKIENCDPNEPFFEIRTQPASDD